jgi:hypothetical protein
LRALGYQGCLVLEARLGPTPAASLARTRARLGALLDEGDEPVDPELTAGPAWQEETPR